MTIDSYNLGAIDVGSNAARLLVKHVDIGDGGHAVLSKQLFLRIPLRLGMDVFADGEVSKERVREFVETMKAFRQLMKVYGVRGYRACATSAMRDARNGREIVRKVRRKSRLRLDIITGDEESRIIYDNHLSLLPSQGCFLYVDVGGGSTEVTFISDGVRLYSHSFNVGTIRLLKGKVRKADVVGLEDEVRRVTAGHQDVRIVGSGGNIGKLYRLALKKRKLAMLPVSVLQGQWETLRRMSVEQRMAQYGLKPDRADVIVPAAEIFLHVASSCGAKEILVPNLGLADGLISEMVKARGAIATSM